MNDTNKVLAAVGGFFLLLVLIMFYWVYTWFRIDVPSAHIAVLIKRTGNDLENNQNPIYADAFVYTVNQPLKAYIPKVFKAALEFMDNHPYAAIRQLAVSQGYFYKIIKISKEAAA